VPAKLGKNVQYALGVIIRPTPSGIAYGHSGFFPGYMTELAYFPEHRMSIALQCNSSDFKKLKISLAKCVTEIANVAKSQ
jgi:D-alanyl-D-alanine carboxypeptidase